MTDTENMVALSAENVLLRQECQRLHEALATAVDGQRFALDGWGQAWDYYRQLADEVRWLRQELGRLQTAVRTPRRTQETAHINHDD